MSDKIKITDLTELPVVDDNDWVVVVDVNDFTHGPQGTTKKVRRSQIQGSDGKTILYGTAAPTTEGVDGDFYIRTTTNFIYGPKAAGSWPAGTSLVGPAGPTGPTGATGAAGNTILYGTAAPTTEGVDGDFYIRTTTNFIYGPKAAGSWPAGTSLVGPTGATGPTGPTGPAGSSGIAYGEITASQAAIINTGYIANSASLITVTLPDTAPVGSIVIVKGNGAGGWKIAQNTGEKIVWDAGGVAGVNETTTGTGGFLLSTDRYDAIELVCIVANTTWAVLDCQGQISLT